MNIIFPKNSECGHLIEKFDWSKTELGNSDDWQVSLKYTVNIILHNSLPQIVFWGPELIQIYNDANRYVLGDRHPEALGKSAKETWASIWPEIGPLVEAALEGKTISYKDFKLPLPPGSNPYKYLHFEFTMTPLFGDEGKIEGILISVLDHTEKVDTIAKLDKAEFKLKNIILNAPVGMAVYSGKNFTIEYPNALFANIAGKKEEDLAGKPLFEAIPEAKGQGLEEILENVYNTNSRFITYERKVLLRNNQGVMRDWYLNFIYEPYTDVYGNVEGIIIVVIDVTDQVISRRRLEELEERNRLAIEIANIGTYDIDIKTDSIITSERFDEIFGVKSKCDRAKYVSLYHPEDKHIRDMAYEDVRKNGYTSYQVRLLLDDGTIKWVKCEAKAYYDSNHEPNRLIGTVLDVTDSVLLQQHKDDFLAIASHELKTPLTSVKGYSQLLENLIRKGDQVIALNIIKKTQRQVDKMSKLIHTFLDVSRMDSSQLNLTKEDFDFNDLVSETVNYFNVPEFKERIRFAAGKVARIFADRQKISLVIDNFVSNALKYSPNDKEIFLKSYPEGNFIVFSVKDCGKGINASSKSKIFQRFYRAENTKNDKSSGFGIGLYFSSEVIKMHKGEIGFESEEGLGSTFYFKLPLS